MRTGRIKVLEDNRFRSEFQTKANFMPEKFSTTVDICLQMRLMDVEATFNDCQMTMAGKSVTFYCAPLGAYSSTVGI
jgi:hypothetical protein